MEWEPRPPVLQFKVVATILSEDSFRLDQRPLDLALRLGTTEEEVEWFWPDVSFDRIGDQITLTVETRPEVRPVSYEVTG
jgi:hypothetical protein